MSGILKLDHCCVLWQLCSPVLNSRPACWCTLKLVAHLAPGTKAVPSPTWHRVQRNSPAVAAWSAQRSCGM
jgi:hypothetical protein